MTAPLHDPLTCRKCSPEPWAQAEFQHRGVVRRWTGWTAVAVTVGPFLAAAFTLGVLAGVLLAMAVAR